MTKEFKIYYDNELASQGDHDAIEEIVVEQEIGRVWEARITIPVCIAEDGSWDSEDEPAFQEFARVRVEARIGDGDFIPLIDGRIIEQRPDYNAVPGSSLVTLVVHDDTTLLHRKTEPDNFSDQSDSDIAESIFDSADLGGTPDIDPTPDHPDNDVVVNQHGTKMQMLRSLAARYKNFYAYVLPGDSPGTSDGCFKQLPTEPDDDLHPLVMVGDDRNIQQFTIQRNSNKAASFDGASLSISDKSVTSASASFSDETPSEGDPSTTGGEDDLRSRRLPEGMSDLAAPDDTTKGAAEDSGFTLSADGNVLPLCYSGILRPYKMIPVRLSNSRYSSNYVIFKVVHTLGRSEYTQSFSVRGNAVSPAEASDGGAPQPAAAPSANINAQGHIF